MIKLQQTLMADDCYLPWHKRELPALTMQADCTAPIVRNGMDRGKDNCWVGKHGNFIEYRFPADTPIHEIRLLFDNNMNRLYHNMPCNYPLVQTKFKLSSTLIKEYRIEGTAESGESFSLPITDNHQRFVTHAVNQGLKTIRFIPLATHGSEAFRLFDFELS